MIDPQTGPGTSPGIGEQREWRRKFLSCEAWHAENLYVGISRGLAMVRKDMHSLRVLKEKEEEKKQYQSTNLG